jgi:hypothetical protein
MRVISQHGNVDLPYEQIIVCHAMENVTALHNEKEYVLGRYSSQEKAYKAMEMLKEHYGLLSFMKLIAGTTNYESFIRRFTEDDFIKATTEYFQFPQDDEIEV